MATVVTQSPTKGAACAADGAGADVCASPVTTVVENAARKSADAAAMAAQTGRTERAMLSPTDKPRRCRVNRGDQKVKLHAFLKPIIGRPECYIRRPSLTYDRRRSRFDSGGSCIR